MIFSIKKYSRGLFSAAFLLALSQVAFSQNSLETATTNTFEIYHRKPIFTYGKKCVKYMPESTERIWFYLSPNAYFNSKLAASNVNAQQRQIYFALFPLWNNYNKTTLGFAVHNKSIRKKNLEFVLAPMLSLNPVGFAFYGKLNGEIPLENNTVKSVSYETSYTRFAYTFDTKARSYNRVFGKLAINFKNSNENKLKNTQLYVRNIFNVLESSDQYRSAFGKKTLPYNVLEFGFYTRNYRWKHPYQLLATIEYIQEFGRFAKPNVSKGKAGKISVEYRQRISYFSHKKGIDIRVFAGTFLGVPKTNLDYRYRLSGYTGIWDYKFDHYYFGRNDAAGITSRQFYENDANFKVLTSIGQSNRWMGAINLKASLPGPIPVKPYLDMALYRQVVTNGITGEQIKNIKFAYSGGLLLSVINDVFEIYFPIFHSKEIKNNLSFNNMKWYNQIRFQINLLELNPKKIKDKLEWLPR